MIAQNVVPEVPTARSRALRLSPGAIDNFWSYGGIASNHFNMGRFEEAVEWALRATSTGAKWPHIYRTLVAAYGLLGRLEEARDALDALLEFKPGLTIAELRRQHPQIVRPQNETWLAGMRLAGLPEGE